MIKLIFPSPMFSELTAQMRADSRESFALILARAGPTVAGWRFLVDSVYMAADGEYEVRSESEVRPSGVFRLKWEKRARLEGLALVYAHSHPHETGELPIWLAALFVLLAVGAMQSRSGGGPKCSLSAKRAPRYQRYALIKRERPDGTAPTQRDPISTLVH